MDGLPSLFSSAEPPSSTNAMGGAPPSFLVGIAVSRAALEALRAFFDTMPVDSGLAFVISQQAPVNSAPVTPEMLSRHTEMPIHVAAHDMPMEGNAVYLIPPGEEMLVAGGRLKLVGSDSREGSTWCGETLFRSLSQDVGDRGICVVLPGTLGAGSPAAPTGFAHLLLPPSNIAAAVLSHARRTSASAVTDVRLAQELEELCLACPREHALAALNSQLAAVLDAATQVSVIATDVDGTIRVFNSGAEAMLGYTSCEMVGEQTPQIFHLATEVEQRGRELSREFGREIHGFEVFVAYAKAGQFERREWTYVRKDGRHLTANLVVTAVRNVTGEITGFLGVAEDISERKRSEEALRKSEERFDLAVAGSNDGLWDWDVRTNEVYYAPRFKELLGYRDEEFENKFASFETSLHPDDRGRTLAKVHRHLEHFEPYDVEYRLRTKGREYRWFRARGQAIWDSSGQAVRMAGSLTDITERKQAEAALKQNAAQIQRANETLRIAEADARRAVVKRDQFLAMLSHELRNPMSAILSGVDVLDHTRADRQAVDGARQAIRRQVDHISRLLDDLLDVARITQGKISFRKQVLDVNELMREAGQAMQPIMEARGHQYSIVSTREPVWVEGDSTRLLQVIGNLLANAAKYTPPQGVIAMELVQKRGCCELSVRDNGRGIDPHLLDEIFDMFFQSDHALDRSDGGMGVGLTLVRTLVEMHQGTVTAHSEGPGHGSQFVVRLPLTSKRPPESTRQIAARAGPGKRVLLVEDNLDSRELLQNILRLDGFQVESAEDGQQGLDAILEQRPHVALIDIGLPKLDGYEVARRVRAAVQQVRDLPCRSDWLWPGKGPRSRVASWLRRAFGQACQPRETQAAATQWMNGGPLTTILAALAVSSDGSVALRSPSLYPFRNRLHRACAAGHGQALR